MWCLRFFSLWRVSLHLSVCSVKTFQNKRKKKNGAIFIQTCCNFSVRFSAGEWHLYHINKTLVAAFFFTWSAETPHRAPRSVNLKCPTLRWRSGAKRRPWCYLLLSVLLKSLLCCLICTVPSVTFMPLVVNKAILNLSRVVQSQTLSARLSCVDAGHWSVCVCVWESE